MLIDEWAVILALGTPLRRLGDILSANHAQEGCAAGLTNLRLVRNVQTIDALELLGPIAILVQR